MQKSFSEILIFLISCIFIFFGIMNLIFTEKVSLFLIPGIQGDYAALLQQFLGSSYLLIAILLFLLKNSKGMPLYITIGAINILACIHLYLILLFHDIIKLPFTYFFFIILTQICLFIALIEQLRKK
jgi:hypothetical protein